MLAALLSGVAACNAVSGAGAIDFTGEACAGDHDAGGDGGAAVSLTCPAGEVVVGIGASAGGLVVSGFGLCCAPLSPGGAVGLESDCTSIAGVDQNFTEDAGCAPSEAVVQLSYGVDPTQGFLAREVSIACQTPSRWAEATATTDSSGAVSTAVTAGDQPESVTPCCHGSVARGVRVRLGYVADAGPYVAGFDGLDCTPAP